ncbi:Uncharacterized protein TPAR_07456 [Tolypocladium paradoxum]|uniref:Uncharacterized protein n=1 Tax=Tolypocladium paradoxum TaxID=94208 RepID=A0A2S4KQ52_9HYPO|nr:Uncharacterized protein TPAR_07456 [Tolypocladium paradoxum]
MNPLATNFTPSTSPEPKVVSQPEVPAPRVPPADKHVASRPTAPVPVYDFGQQSAGPAPSIYHFHPEIGYYHDFDTAQRNTAVPDNAPSQDDFAIQWSQHQTFAGYHGTPDAHPFPPAVQAFARSNQGLEPKRGPSHPTTETGGRDMDLMWPSLPPQAAPGARQTVCGSHVTEGQTNRDDAPEHSNNAGYQLHSDMKQPRSLPWVRGDIESPIPQVRVTDEQRYLGQYGTRGTQTASQPSRGREPAAVNAQQAPFLMIQPPIQSNSSAQGVLGTQQATPSLQVSGQTQPLSGSRGDRGRSAHQSSLSGTTRRQSSHRGVGSLDEGQSDGIEKRTRSSRSRPGLGDRQDSPYGYPSPQLQRRDATGIAWPSLVPIVTASRIPSPAETPSSAMMSTPARITPAQTPTRMPLLEPVQRSSLTPSETSSSQANKRVDTGGHKPSGSSEQRQDHDLYDPQFAPCDGADALQQRDERGLVGGATSSQHAAALSGPSATPRHREQSAAASQQLNDTPPYTHVSQMTSSDGNSGREPAETSSPPSRTSAPAESGAWSQSKRWMSEEAKGRMSFARMMNNLRHIGADKSPAIPRSLTELAAFKAVVAEAKRRELKRVVGQRLEELERRKGLTEEELRLADVKIEKLFWGNRPNDKFSPVLAYKSCFNDPVSDEYELRVDWPSLAELKEEGEHRGGRYRRYFPLPRLNVIDPRLLVTGQEEVYNPDGTIRWQMKAVKYDTTFLLPISPQRTTNQFFADGRSHLPTMQSFSAGSKGCPSTCRHFAI